MLAPATCSLHQAASEGVFWCAGGSCSPQTLFLLTRSSSSSPLGILKHQVLWSWVMVMWLCHGLGQGGPTVGSPACGSGWTRSLVFFARSSTNPPNIAFLPQGEVRAPRGQGPGTGLRVLQPLHSAHCGAEEQAAKLFLWQIAAGSVVFWLSA